ncbi:MAG: FtsQ-type POTRA domain-containing protein [Actinomycetota bacterium]|nr:FtsQ-type POTRA domain-containing protein [Actinomycetota bacterium]
MLQLRFAATALLLVAVVSGGVSLYRSSAFTIEKIDVVGNSRLGAADVRAIAALPDGSTLLRYPAGQIKERLEASPWISEASVARDFPNVLRIRITERKPYALLDLGGAKLWMLDSSGFVIGEQTADVTSTVVVVRDVTGADPRPGTRTASEPVLNAIAVWAGISQPLRERTRAISAPSIDKTALITTDDIEILVGASDDIGKKDLLARQILRDQKGKVVYISVRSVERPTWRGIDTPQP